MTDNLPITKQQFDDSIMPFVDKYKRLPYLSEDDIEIEVEVDGEIEIRPYRSSRYISAYYGSQERMTSYLIDNDIITYKFVAEITGYTETVITNAITKSTKNPEVGVRRGIHNFFNFDFYEKELGKFAKRCVECKNSCKQFYWAEVRCPNFKAKK